MADEETKEPAKPVDPVQERKDREKEGMGMFYLMTQEPKDNDINERIY